jgi:GNAT superfamily N-acetyltransferase
MFQVKAMSSEDWLFALDLANIMNWNMAPQDFQYAATLEPNGCFILTEGEKRIGLATCIAYGKVGWFGNLIVKPQFRGKGAGSFLVQHAIDYLQGRGAETVGLYSYPNLLKFYSDMGFAADQDFVVLHARNVVAPAAEILPKIKSKDLENIIKFDCECFGGNREKLLQSILSDKDNFGYYLSEQGKVAGYIAAKLYDGKAEIGPLVCKPKRTEAALMLIKAALAKLGGSEVYVWGLPKKQAALVQAFLGFGFKEEFSVTRMFLGKAAAKNCIYIAESLERG